MGGISTNEDEQNRCGGASFEELAVI